MHFNHVLTCKLRRVVESDHFGFAAYFDLLLLFAFLDGQSLGVRIKADNFSLKGFGGASGKNGTC